MCYAADWISNRTFTNIYSFLTQLFPQMSSRLLMLHDIITKVKLNKMYLYFDGFGKSFL